MRFADHVKTENMEELLFILHEKDSIISRYNLILKEWNKIGLSLDIKDGYNNPDFMNLLFQMFPPLSSGKGSFSVKLESFVNQKKTLLEELIKIEDGVQEDLSDYVKRLRVRISQVSKGRDACKGYAQAGGSSISGR
jgi:hypothetical protein